MVKRTTAIEKATTPKTIKWISKNENKLRFDLAIQRNGVWKSEQRSLFIHSLIYGYPFPPAYAQDTNDGFLWLLDGKQRLTCVIDFVHDRFELHKNTPDVFGFDVAGMRFSELPEDFQDEILSTNFSIIQLKNMTNEERDQMFVRLNGGTALSKLEVTRAMYSDLFAEVGVLADLPFFKDTINVTSSARNRFVDQELVVQIAMLLDEDHKLKGFGGQHVRDYVMSLKEGGMNFSQEMVAVYNEMSEYLSESFKHYSKKDLAKALKKINVPMVFSQGIKAKADGMKPRQYGDFIQMFLVEEYTIESAYGQACQAGSAKKESVTTRIDAIEKAYKKYIKKNPIGDYKFEEKTPDVQILTVQESSAEPEVASADEGNKAGEGVSNPDEQLQAVL